MNRSIVVVIAASLLLVAGCGASSPNAAVPSASPAGASLDGTAYEVTLLFPGEEPVKDTLKFDAGKFESSACTALGFPKWTEYSTRRDGDQVAFEVATHNPQGPVVEWTGSVRGGAASGKAKRTMNGKTDLGTFQGAAR